MKHIWIAEYMRQIEDCSELDIMHIKHLNELKKRFAKDGEIALCALVDDVLRENIVLHEINSLPDINEDAAY